MAAHDIPHIDSVGATVGRKCGNAETSRLEYLLAVKRYWWVNTMLTYKNNQHERLTSDPVIDEKDMINTVETKASNGIQGSAARCGDKQTSLGERHL